MAKKSRRSSGEELGGAGVFSLFERHWEEVKNTEQINNASQLQFRNANQVAASKTHYR